jgi:hypothetical protein
MHTKLPHFWESTFFGRPAWSSITSLSKLRRKGVSGHVEKVVGTYLTGRVVQLGSNRTKTIEGGVPQGSVLGPTLWNVLYDDVMETEVPSGVELICCADDLAISVTAEDKQGLTIKVDEALHAVAQWMKRNQPELAPEKTVAVVLNGRKDDDIAFSLEETLIGTSHQVTSASVPWRGDVAAQARR